VTYVVPNGFRGFVCIAATPAGASIEAGTDQLVSVPDSGIVLARSLDFETQWAQRRWRFADGTQVPFLVSQFELDKVADDQVIAFGIGSQSVNHRPTVMATAITTKSELTRVRHEWHEGAVYDRALAAAGER
jgi:hypothetical protein